ncbi:MAG: sporulation integral membrane protein YtvI [Clostridiales bacterium]|nr:sporulation integral membrane protein YtvI [Clostridiales bacterium]
MKKRYMKAIVNLFVAAVTLLLCIFVLPKLLMFFMPFVIGWIISLIASPLVRFFEEKLKVKRKAGSAVVIVSVIAGVILLFYVASVKLVQEAAGFIQSLPEMWQSMEADFASIGKNLDVLFARFPREVQEWFTNISLNAEDYIGDLVSNISTPTMNAVGNFAKNVPTVIISIIMCLLASYFFVADKEGINSFCKRCMPAALQEKWFLITGSVKSAVGGYFKAQFKIEVWIYLLLVIGLMILGIDYSFLIAFGIAILDLLPFFGTGAVMWPWAIVKFLSGDYKMTIGLLIIWGVGQLVRQIIQPKIVGDSIGLAPMPTLLLLFIGYKFGGVLGMIIAIPIGIVVVNMYEAGVFNSARDSIRILVNGVNSFRKLTEEDRNFKDNFDGSIDEKSDEKL